MEMEGYWLRKCQESAGSEISPNEVVVTGENVSRD
jgi:hypothetical protein